MEFNRNEMYLAFLLENRADRDVEIDSIEFGISSYEEQKRSEEAKKELLEKKCLYLYNAAGIIPKGADKIFIGVFKKFRITNHEKFLVKLNESIAVNNLELYLDGYIINSAN